MHPRSVCGLHDLPVLVVEHKPAVVEPRIRSSNTELGLLTAHLDGFLLSLGNAHPVFVVGVGGNSLVGSRYRVT